MLTTKAPGHGVVQRYLSPRSIGTDGFPIEADRLSIKIDRRPIEADRLSLGTNRTSIETDGLPIDADGLSIRTDGLPIGIDGPSIGVHGHPMDLPPYPQGHEEKGSRKDAKDLKNARKEQDSWQPVCAASGPHYVTSSLPPFLLCASVPLWFNILPPHAQAVAASHLAIACLRIARPSFSSASVITRGGRSRTARSPAVSTRSPSA